MSVELNLVQMGIKVLLDEPLDRQAHGFDVRFVNGHSADCEVVSRVVETPTFVDVEEDHGKKKGGRDYGPRKKAALPTANCVCKVIRCIADVNESGGASTYVLSCLPSKPRVLLLTTVDSERVRSQNLTTDPAEILRLLAA